MSAPVALFACPDYQPETVAAALTASVDAVDGLSFLRPGMTVAVKANLVSAMDPDSAATTHPSVLSALASLLLGRGASRVIIGDSPGGLFTVASLNHVYKACGLAALERDGVVLNRDVGQREADNPDGRVLRRFSYTSWLDTADAVINFAKLKSHGMMGLSCAAKNMFGAIPGLSKPEYHFRFPSHTDFAEMILDLDAYFHPVLHLCDAVVGMEGNGPTQGKPRPLGALLASPCPHSLDLVAASLIGLTPDDIPTLHAAVGRGLIPARAEDIRVLGCRTAQFTAQDFDVIRNRSGILFEGNGKNPVRRLASSIIRKCLASVPYPVTSDCISCLKCGNICPAKAITFPHGKPRIDRSACIRCFCCQEFCPVGAMKVKRPLVAKILNR